MDSGGNLQVAAVIGGQVYHRIRYASGSWTAWGLVGNSGTATAVGGAIDNTATTFQLVAVVDGQVYHRIRNSNGSWTAWGLVGNGGTATAVGAAIDPSRNLQVVAVF